LQIRKCTIEDVKVLQSVCRQAFSETFLKWNSEENVTKYIDETYAIDVLESELRDDNSVVFLAFDDNGKAIGYLKLNREGAQTEKDYPDSLEVQRIYVLKEAKGQGVGSKFMELAEKQAKEWDVSYMWLGVWEHNDPALKFYKGKGFERFSVHTFVLGDKPQTDYIMRKDVK